MLDLSRLLSRLLHSTPTGVDRVEMAYARGLMRTIPGQLHFAGLHPNGTYGRLNGRAVRRFLDRTEADWSDVGQARRARLWLHAARAVLALHPRRVPAKREGVSRIYLQASPHHLDNEARVAAILRRERARFVCLVHDLIPIEFPEYVRAGGDKLHRRRIATLVRHADGIVANSAATLDSFRPFAAAAERPIMLRVAHLGFPDEGAEEPAAPRGGPPYFVCIGTIEPRKNHLLLLNVWRRMVETCGGNAIPKLILVGRRGWENEQVVDMLERCPALRGHVEERGRLPDREVRRLLAGARALLLPSFAEGFGMPVSEALAMGTPVICSDLPALREAGGSTPLYLDPLDGIAWMRAIANASAEPVAERRAPVSTVPLPTWSEHLAIVLDLVHRLAT
ncbi:MAG: group 1 glycosyl transferase [Sphingomonas bacterium]|nr:group 1 glycosyl transferase [Sphingomonas bacterium]